MKVQRKVAEVEFHADEQGYVWGSIELTDDELWEAYFEKRQQIYEQFVHESIHSTEGLINELNNLGIDIDYFEGEVFDKFIRNVEKYDMRDCDAVDTAIGDTITSLESE